MKNKISKIFDTLYTATVIDHTNGYLIAVALVVFSLNTLMWKLRLAASSTETFWRIGISPLVYLAIVLAINLFLGLFAYKKEKEICYLLFATNCLLAFLVFALEISYLINL